VSEALLTEERLREAVAEYSRRLHRAGWVANHDGNVSVRAASGRWLATPTAVSKGAVTPDQVLVLDADGKKLAGRGQPFSEIGLHVAAWKARPDAAAVLHAHPPSATGLAVAGVKLDVRIMAEPVVSLGDVPLVPFAAPGAPAVEALRAYLAGADAFLLEQHGVLTLGSDLETAFLRLELVEHLARITLAARAAGGARPLAADVVAQLLEGRRKAGLGPAAAAGGAAGPASAPSAPRATVLAAPAPGLREIIAAEVARALRGG
jgi:L-fuculose-phosphate aldolase